MFVEIIDAIYSIQKGRELRRYWKLPASYEYSSHAPVEELFNRSVPYDILMGKKSIKDAIIENIKHYFSNGIEYEYRGCSSDLLPDLDDSRVQRIMNRYDIYS